MVFGTFCASRGWHFGPQFARKPRQCGPDFGNSGVLRPFAGEHVGGGGGATGERVLRVRGAWRGGRIRKGAEPECVVRVICRRKENLVKQPSALAFRLGSVQSPRQVLCLQKLCVSMRKLSFLSTEASAAQPDRRHVEILHGRRTARGSKSRLPSSMSATTWMACAVHAGPSAQWPN